MRHDTNTSRVASDAEWAFGKTSLYFTVRSWGTLCKWRKGERVTSGSDARIPALLDITVIVCTYNRCRILADTLANVDASEMPSSVTWEVLVVDNNSTDQTREVVCDFHRRQPERFRYLLEPKHGKSYALNAGIATAGGAGIAFL